MAGCSGAEVECPRELSLHGTSFFLLPPICFKDSSSEECFKLIPRQMSDGILPSSSKRLSCKNICWIDTIQKLLLVITGSLTLEKRPGPTETPDGSAALKERKTPSDLCSGFHKVKHRRLLLFYLLEKLLMHNCLDFSFL